MLTIIGLGMEPEDLTYRALKALESADTVYLRTGETPHAAFLSSLNISCIPLDFLYEESEDYTELCEKIAQRVTENGDGDIVYACPGSAAVGDETVRAVSELCRKKQIPVRILPGISAADTAAASALGVPALQLLSAHSLTADMLNPRYALVVEEIDDAFLASDVKLQLLDIYPEDLTVFLSGKEMPLSEIDRENTYNETTTLLIPPVPLEGLSRYDIRHLLSVVGKLRDPLHGCPWDRVQTHESILKNLVEESYEVIQAVKDDDPDALTEELGDLLFQILMHVRMSEETGDLNLTDVISGITGKMISSHGAIFGAHNVHDAQEMTQLWDETKRASRGSQTRTEGMLALPASFPALLRADKVQGKAAMVGFDWDSPSPALMKVREEA